MFLQETQETVLIRDSKKILIRKGKVSVVHCWLAHVRFTYPFYKFLNLLKFLKYFTLLVGQSKDVKLFTPYNLLTFSSNMPSVYLFSPLILIIQAVFFNLSPFLLCYYISWFLQLPNFTSKLRYIARKISTCIKC